MDERAWKYVRTLAFAALLGVPVAVASVLFQTAVHDIIHFVWEVVPDWLGWSQPAAWYVVLVPGLAGILVALAVRLPGGTAGTRLSKASAWEACTRSSFRASFSPRSRPSVSGSYSDPRRL